MRYNGKLNRYEAQEIKRQQIEKALAGSGRYIFANNTPGEINFPPRPNKKLKPVAKGETFEGDSYYLQFVKTHELRLVKVLEEANSNQEKNMGEEKLILDQPDTFNESGKVEHVIPPKTPIKPLHEENKSEEKQVLLNETPVPSDGFEIVS